MIPKVIHYCWLSDDPIPVDIQKYIDGWKDTMPDYSIKKWDRKAFDLDKHPFAKQAFECKKYAFAADYIRVYALYNEGGIYLDSDVKVLKRFDEFLQYSYFTSVENQLSHCNYKLLINRFIDKEGHLLPGMKCYFMGLQAAIIGAEAGNILVKEILEYYQKQNFILTDGTFFHNTAPIVHASFAEKYGFVYKDEEQKLADNMIVFSAKIFATQGFNEDKANYAIHCCKGSWLKKDKSWKRFLKRSAFLRDLNLKYRIISKKNDANLLG